MQRRLVYVTKKEIKTPNMCPIFVPEIKKRHKSAKKCQKENKSAIKLSIVDTFGILLATYTNFVCRSDSVRQKMFFFVAVIHCNKLNFSLSQ